MQIQEDESSFSNLAIELRKLIEGGTEPQDLAIRLGRMIDVIVGDVDRIQREKDLRERMWLEEVARCKAARKASKVEAVAKRVQPGRPKGQKRCTSKAASGVQCRLKHGHDGPHRWWHWNSISGHGPQEW